MSTNKTQNYQLHKWEADDDFLRTEFNENFAKIDGALHTLDGAAVRMAFGSYTGESTMASSTQRIELGFAPKAVIVFPSSGDISIGSGYALSGIAGQGKPLQEALVLDNSGFTVANQNQKYLFNYHYTYYYIALY